MEQEYQNGPTKDDRTMAMLCHLSVFLGSFIPPLIIWLLKKDDSEFVDFHGREVLNFQISMFIYGIVSTILILVVVGFFMLAALGIFGLIFTIIGAIKAHDGEYFRYPLSIRFL